MSSINVVSSQYTVEFVYTCIVNGLYYIVQKLALHIHNLNCVPSWVKTIFSIISGN